MYFWKNISNAAVKNFQPLKVKLLDIVSKLVGICCLSVWKEEDLRGNIRKGTGKESGGRGNSERKRKLSVCNIKQGTWCPILQGTMCPTKHETPSKVHGVPLYKVQGVPLNMKHQARYMVSHYTRYKVSN